MDKFFTKPISNSEAGVLAKLWRKIIIENNMKQKLMSRINDYLNKSPINSRVKVVKKKNRSTIMENAFDGKMTMKVFLYLVFNILRAKSVDITIKVNMPDGKCSLHNITVDSNCLEDDDDLSMLEITGQDKKSEDEKEGDGK